MVEFSGGSSWSSGYNLVHEFCTRKKALVIFRLSEKEIALSINGMVDKICDIK
jgi:hypothetical protein